MLANELYNRTSHHKQGSTQSPPHQWALHMCCKRMPGGVWMNSSPCSWQQAQYGTNAPKAPSTPTTINLTVIYRTAQQISSQLQQGRIVGVLPGWESGPHMLKTCFEGGACEKLPGLLVTNSGSLLYGTVKVRRVPPLALASKPWAQEALEQCACTPASQPTHPELHAAKI